jgi:hypothetical protein
MNRDGDFKIGIVKVSEEKSTGPNSVRHDICSLVNSYSVLVSFADCMAMFHHLQAIIAQH